jgi:tRNA A-37 threonylcarbamoyl transferase component Bud32
VTSSEERVLPNDSMKKPPERGGRPDDKGAPTAVEIPIREDVASLGESDQDTRARPARPPSRPAHPRVVDAPDLPSIHLPGRYRDDGLIGRGGMGAVRSLRDAALRREIAAKTLSPPLAQHALYLQSFVEEAQLTAQLDHPNIVPVYELGTDSTGMLYFTMKRVRGRTLHALLQDPALPPGSSERLSIGLEVFLKTCDALAFAHSRGVLHRDIKPDNIMVGEYGEVYLMDWGLAKILHDRGSSVDVPRDPGSPLALSEEAVVGTPSFMAPEMASHAFDRVDERADIFGLGAVLYQIATGRMPYYARSVDDILALAQACNWLPPDAYDDTFVPKKLARVIGKAMARVPADRYPTVVELAAQVREFLHRGHHLPRVVHPAGTVIVREGDPSDRAYIVTRGRCEVYRTVGGERRVLRQLGPGSVFGEAAILGSAPRVASVIALTEVTTLVLTPEILEERLGADTWEGLVTKTLIERFRELDAKLDGA